MNPAQTISLLVVNSGLQAAQIALLQGKTRQEALERAALTIDALTAFYSDADMPQARMEANRAIAEVL